MSLIHVTLSDIDIIQLLNPSAHYICYTIEQR